MTTEDAALEQFEPLVRKIAQPFYGTTSHSYEDWYQVGRIGIIKAVRSFRPGGKALRHWVYLAIHRELIDEMRKATGRRRVRGMLTGTEHASVGFVELMAVTHSFGPSVEARCDIDILSQSLPPRDRRLIAQRWLGDKTQADCAREFGVTDGRIGQIESAALRKMREAACGIPVK